MIFLLLKRKCVINNLNNKRVNLKKVLVTGGAGFIGSELVCQLASIGHRVIIVDNLANGKRENVGSLLSDRVELVIGDIRDKECMSRQIREADVIFHLACLGVRHSIHSPHENHEVNASATLQLLSLARQAGVKRFVHVSSSEVYGTAHWVPMTEDHPTFPMTIYGASKLAGECYARAFYETYGYPTVVVRPFNTYGPRCHHEGDSGEVIPKFLLRSMAGKPMVIFGDGTQTRDFTYVSDTARGIMEIGFSDQAIGQTINIGSGYELSINALARKVSSVLDSANAKVVHDDPRPGDVLRLYADITKAQVVIGFKSRVSLSEGITGLRNWYLQQGILPEKLLEQEKVRNWELGG
jgi:UDP-glucose 4-epimerase